MKKLLALCLTFVMIISVVPMFSTAVSAETNDLYRYAYGYSEQFGGAVIYGFNETDLCPNGQKVDVKVPSYLGGYPVVAISNLSGTTKIRFLELPETLEVIGTMAFSYSAIEEIYIPDSVVSMAGCAFTGCNQLTRAYCHQGGPQSGHVSRMLFQMGIFRVFVDTFESVGTYLTYNGKVQRPKIYSVSDRYEQDLIENVHYTVSAPKSINVGTYSMVINFMNGYYGSKTYTYTINPMSEGINAKLSTTSYIYNGKVKSPVVTVKNAIGKKLVKGKDYTVKYNTTRKNAGKHKVTVTMKGNYTGTKELYFTIKPKSSGVKASLSATNYTYNGKVKNPTITVKNSNGTKLVKGKDYTVKYYTNRKDAGKHKIGIIMKGNYSGAKYLYFNIKDTSPKKLQGWKYNSTGYRYYINGKCAYGWQLIGGSWYYFKSNGYMATGWVNDGGTWYYMNASGAMVTGWVLDGNSWYYMNSSGAMTTGWVLDGNTWYYMNSSGAMATGWVLDGNTWYWLESSGVWSGYSEPA